MPRAKKPAVAETEEIKETKETKKRTKKAAVKAEPAETADIKEEETIEAAVEDAEQNHKEIKVNKKALPTDEPKNETVTRREVLSQKRKN